MFRRSKVLQRAGLPWRRSTTGWSPRCPTLARGRTQPALPAGRWDIRKTLQPLTLTHLRTRSGTTCPCTSGFWRCRTRGPASPPGGRSTRRGSIVPSQEGEPPGVCHLLTGKIICGNIFVAVVTWRAYKAKEKRHVGRLKASELVEGMTANGSLY